MNFKYPVNNKNIKLSLQGNGENIEIVIQVKVIRRR